MQSPLMSTWARDVPTKLRLKVTHWHTLSATLANPFPVFLAFDNFAVTYHNAAAGERTMPRSRSPSAEAQICLRQPFVTPYSNGRGHLGLRSRCLDTGTWVVEEASDADRDQVNREADERNQHTSLDVKIDELQA